MPSFSDLRSDYPLNFSLFECLFWGALKHRFVVTVLPVPPVGLHSRIGENAWSVSWVLPQVVPSKKSAYTLAQATPSVAQIWSRLVASLAHPAEQRRTNLRRNIGPSFRELTASLRLHKSAACRVVDVRMLSTSLGHSHEHLVHSPDCLPARLRANKEVSSYELTPSLLCGKSPACDVLDVDVPSIPAPHPSPMAVPGEHWESAGTAHEVRNRYPWLAMNGLTWFACLIFESNGPRLIFEVVTQTRLCALSAAPIWQHGEPAAYHSTRHRRNRTVTKVDEIKSPWVQQCPSQLVGASKMEINKQR
jgi:hypothetical protein